MVNIWQASKPSGVELVTTVIDDDTVAPSSGAVVDFVGASGGGDMLKASYDPANKTEQVLTISDVTGTNTGDQTTIAGITGTKAEFNTAVTDGDIVYTDTGIEGSAIVSTGEVGGTKFLREDGDGTSSWNAVPGSGGDALVANPLSQFAATTSAQLLGVISDETGTGGLVFASSPTLVTPALGTPSALVGTNISGTASSLTSGAVSNATLTTAVTVDTGTVGLTGNVANTSVLTLAAGASSISGDNTGDQTTVSGNAGTVTNATLTTALTVDTGTVGLTGNVANDSVLTLASGASSISGSNTGDQTTVSGNAGTVTNATLTTAITVDTGTVGLAGNASNDSVLTLGSGASSVSGANTGDQTISDATITTTDIATNDVSSTKHGFAPKGDGTTTKFLNANGAYSEPAGSGDVSKVGTPVDSQVGVWTGDGSIEGAASLTYDGSNLQMTGDIGSTGTRITKAWVTDLESTNAITGSITGNAATVTNATLTTAVTVNTGTVGLTGNVANTSVLTLGAGASSISGANTGDQTSVSGNAGTVTNGVYTTDNLSVLAATTSAQLAGVISDETGSGALVFATSPTLDGTVVINNTGTGSNPTIASNSATQDLSLTANVIVSGDLKVQGTTTTIDTSTLLVEDKNIELGNVTTPTDITADGGGITLLGDTNKTILWDNANDNWTTNQSLNIATGLDYKINNTSVLNATTLGSSVVGSSLTSVGILTSLNVAGKIAINSIDRIYVPDQTDYEGTIYLGNGDISGILTTVAKRNTYVGIGSGESNTAGADNSTIGFNTLYSNTTGYNNVAIGTNSLYSNTEGTNNTASGLASLYSNVSGVENTSIGAAALYYNINSSNNTAIGAFAGRWIADGATSNITTSNSVYIGHTSKASADGVTNENVFGYNAIGSGSNTISLGDSNIIGTYLRGDILLDGTSINTAGTLDNVAYLDQANTFTASNEFDNVNIYSGIDTAEDEVLTLASQFSSTGTATVIKFVSSTAPTSNAGCKIVSERTDSPNTDSHKMILRTTSGVGLWNDALTLHENGSATILGSLTVSGTGDSSFAGNVSLGQTTISQISDTVNAETKILDTFADTLTEGLKYDYLISDGTNKRFGTILVVIDATGDAVSYTETSSADIGDTSDFTFSVSIVTNNVELSATATNNYTSVKLSKYRF